MLLNAWKSVAVGRGEQVACLLLSTVPLAERMLLYQAPQEIRGKPLRLFLPGSS